MTNVCPSKAKVGQVVALRMEAVLVSRPGDGVGDSLPLVRVGAAPHVAASLGIVTRVGDAILLDFDSVACFIPEGFDKIKQRIAETKAQNRTRHRLLNCLLCMYIPEAHSAKLLAITYR